MRLIKFRAWDKSEEKMYHWDRHFFYDTSPVTGYSGEFPEADDSTIVLMQFTGLHDKDDKEVFDGDILQSEGDTKYKVIWSQESASFRLKILPDGLKFSNRVIPFSALGIIGNIYENSELLK